MRTDLVGVAVEVACRLHWGDGRENTRSESLAHFRVGGEEAA